MTYCQLTSGERYMLAALRKQGLNQSKSARLDGHYRPSKAQERTNGRRSRSRRNLRFTEKDFARVDDLLGKQWSPEQVAGYLSREGQLSISHETIYRHIWRDKKSGGLLHTHLRCARKRRRKRYGSHDSRGKLAGKRLISERPASVETRSQTGHWEIDTVMGTGSKDCIVSLVERKSGLLLIGTLEDRTTASLNRRVIHLISRHDGLFETITADNGTEFHDYKGIEERTKATFYFATPYHSWERGSNENANGLIRQYLPRGTSMAALSQQLCNSIARKLNTRPRKRFGFRTPLECYNES